MTAKQISTTGKILQDTIIKKETAKINAPTTNTATKTTNDYATKSIAYAVTQGVKLGTPILGGVTVAKDISSGKIPIAGDMPIPAQNPQGQLLTFQDTAPYVPILTKTPPTTSTIPATGVAGWADTGISTDSLGLFDKALIGVALVAGAWIIGSIFRGKK